MPFGSESTGDQRWRWRGLWQSTRRHQCLSAASPLGTKSMPGGIEGNMESPMPFGSESTGDKPNTNLGSWWTPSVTNAFRQRVHWGLTLSGYEFEGTVNSHQCLSAASPLGTGSCPVQPRPRPGRHQCLSAASPLGTYSLGDIAPEGARLVTNAFRQRVHWGPRESSRLERR